MPWNDLANNQTISFTNLKDAVDTGVLSPKTTVPVSNEQITKADADAYAYIDTLFGPYASKTSNQLVVKSNLRCAVPVINTANLLWWGIDNNETTSSPIQLISGYNNNGDGRIFRSTDYGNNYSSVLLISDGLFGIRFMPAFRHASYLTVPPFVSVGINGRIVTNSVTDASSWVTVSSPTTRSLYDVAFNSSVGIIVGNTRILKTNTNNRINAWSIVNSNNSVWRAVASDGSRFVAVGDASAILAGDSLGTTWTVGNMPALTPSKALKGVTYHTDGFFYAVGFDSTSSAPYIMRSSDSGFNWSLYSPTGDPIIDPLLTIRSISGRLVIGAIDYQYQIFNNVVSRCGATVGGVSIDWSACIKNANSNGFDMAGNKGNSMGAYSNF